MSSDLIPPSVQYLSLNFIVVCWDLLYVYYVFVMFPFSLISNCSCSYKMSIGFCILSLNSVPQLN